MTNEQGFDPWEKFGGRKEPGEGFDIEPQEEYTPEEYTPPANGDNVPLVLGITLAGLGALVLLSGGKKKGPINFTGGRSECVDGAPWVTLGWTSSTQDTTYDILRDGHIVDTIRGLQWQSGPRPLNDQGVVHTYQIIGVQTGTKSPEGKFTTATCVVVGQPDVKGMTAVFV